MNNMGIELAARKPHVLVIPFPAQGHINPSLAFAKCLASKGLQITLVITTSVASTAKLSECSSVTIASISDGSEKVKETETVEAYLKRLRTVFSHNLTKFVDDQRTSSNCARAIIYDSVMPWVQDIARERGLLCASFFTQTCAVSAVFYHIKQGLLRYPYEGTVSLPALPSFEIKHLPSFSFLPDTNDQLSSLKLLTDQFSNLEKADWIFFNTFHELESEIIEWMRSRWPTIKTVGPTFLLEHNDQKLSDSKTHTISLFEPKQDACREWLDSRDTTRKCVNCSKNFAATYKVATILTTFAVIFWRRQRWRLLAVEQIGGCSNQVPHSSSAAGESVRYNRNVAVVRPSFTQRQSHFFFYFVLCPPLLFCPEIIISPTDEFEATSSCERRNSYLFPAGLLIAVHKDYFRVTNNKKLLLDDFGDSVLNYCMSS